MKNYNQKVKIKKAIDKNRASAIKYTISEKDKISESTLINQNKEVRKMERIPAVEITNFLDKTVRISGWVDSVRSHGKIIFVDLRDRSGLSQLVFTPHNEEIYEIAKQLHSEWVIEVKGKVSKRPPKMVNPKIKTGEVEISVDSLEVLSEADTSPIPVSEEEAEESNIDKRMDWRWIDLRKSKKRLIFEVWTTMEQAWRKYLVERGYIEIHSPKLMSVPSESGAELFEVIYFDRKAYLAQSPQFYKQMAMAAGFEKVFEFAPAFRADPSFTSRHCTEFISYDAEISFVKSHQDVMHALEEMIVHALTAVKEKHGKTIEEVYVRKLLTPEIPFPQVTMNEAKQILKKLGIPSKERGDLSPEEEKALSEYILKEQGHEFAFVTEYPSTVRPFYHMRKEDDPSITKSFDLLWNGLEITTGAQREHRYKILKKQAEEKGLDIKTLQNYLNFFRYGCPPHGGFGLGPSRMLMKILNVINVRETNYLYRGVKRLTP